MRRLRNFMESKVLGFLLLREQEELKPYLRQLVNIKWTKSHKKIFNLVKDYSKVNKPDCNLVEFVCNDYTNKAYIAKLISSEGAMSKVLAQKNIDKLISTRENALLKTKLYNLKDESLAKTLSEVKNMKGLTPIKPLDLNDTKDIRLIDREYEKMAPSTGYEGLDNLVKGFVPGHVYTMTGATNIGKSTMACNFAYRVAKQKKKVLYFSLEPGATIIEYLASIWSNKRFSEVTADDLTPPVDIDVYTKEHVDSLEDMVSIVENSERYDLIIIDHFGYFISGSNNKTANESDAMKVMASFAKENKTAVLIIVHPRKPSGSRKKDNLTLHDISGSAAFSQDATDVLIIARKKDEDDALGVKYTNEGFIAVHKSKSGPNGAVPINFVDGSALILEDSEVADLVVKGF
jgi:archaellum biogenesis ATPase FlaH